MKKTFRILLISLLALFCITGYVIKERHMTIPFLYRNKAGNEYTIVTSMCESPFVVDTARMVPIRTEQFNMHPTCRFMADPFIVRDDNDFYIFYEEMSAKMNSTWGDVSVLHSKNLVDWERIGVALDEPFHLSFPNVFKCENEWYMIPETSAIGEIRLYKATDFPLKWAFHATLMQDFYGVDPVLVYKDGVWYLMCSTSDGLQLYFSKTLAGNYTKHPCSPIRSGMQETRPAGPAFSVNDTLYYSTQRHDGGYGTSVVLFRIDSISTDYFRDSRMDNNPIVYNHGNEFARDGMHQFSVVFVEEKQQYITVMDGCRHTTYVEWGWDWRNFPTFRFQ